MSLRQRAQRTSVGAAPCLPIDHSELHRQRCDDLIAACSSHSPLASCACSLHEPRLARTVKLTGMVTRGRKVADHQCEPKGAPLLKIGEVAFAQQLPAINAD